MAAALRILSILLTILRSPEGRAALHLLAARLEKRIRIGQTEARGNALAKDAIWAAYRQGRGHWPHDTQGMRARYEERRAAEHALLDYVERLEEHGEPQTKATQEPPGSLPHV